MYLQHTKSLCSNKHWKKNKSSNEGLGPHFVSHTASFNVGWHHRHTFLLTEERETWDSFAFTVSTLCLHAGSLCFWKKQRNTAIPTRSDLLTSGYVHTLWKCRLKTPIFYCAAYFKYYGTLTFYIPVVIINRKLGHVWLFSSNKRSNIKENKQASRSAKYSTVLILIINQGHRQFILVSVAEANLLGTPQGMFVPMYPGTSLHQDGKNLNSSKVLRRINVDVR